MRLKGGLRSRLDSERKAMFANMAKRTGKFEKSNDSSFGFNDSSNNVKEWQAKPAQIKTTFKTNKGQIIKSHFTIKELWENTKLVSQYHEGTDSDYLIGKDFLSWSKNNKMLYHEMKLVKISDIVESSESLNKEPIYKNKITQAPPIDLSPLDNGKYRIFNGHRRYSSAKARNEKMIFAEIVHIVTLINES